MKTFLKKRRELIAIAIYVCVLGAVGYFIVRPLLAEINRRRDQIQEETATQDDQKKQIAELPSIKEQYLSVQSKGGTLNVLLDKNDAVTLIEDIEQLAQNTQNEVKITISQNDPNSRDAIAAQKDAASQKQPGDKSVSIRDALPSKNYLEMNIAITGQYNAIVNFMEKIENMQYYSDIISFDMKKDDSEKNPVAQSSGVISSSPFSAQGQGAAPAAPAPVSSADQKIAATLDVVFYLKQ